GAARLACLRVLSFDETTPPEIYTLSLTTLFRSERSSKRSSSAPRRRCNERWIRERTVPAGILKKFPISAALSFLKNFRTRIFWRSEEHTSELQSRENLVCRLLLEKKNNNNTPKP